MSTEKKYSLSHYLLVITMISSALLSVSCSKTPDVRLTMCQDLMVLLLDPQDAIEWQEHKPVIRGYNDLEMPASYSTVKNAGKIQKASCFYAYVQNQDGTGAEEFNTPTAAYSTYPNKMILNGKVVNKMELTNGVNAIMVRQGNKAITKATEKMKEGLEKVTEAVEKHL
jgi:hypothetical protein